MEHIHWRDQLVVLDVKKDVKVIVQNQQVNVQVAKQVMDLQHQKIVSNVQKEIMVQEELIVVQDVKLIPIHQQMDNQNVHNVIHHVEI